VNYRHHYHAGNFADVWKHALVRPLIRGMQRKEKGFLFLDTHAGRGSYDLQKAEHGDSLERKPEHPDGIGRLWSATDLSAVTADYVTAIKAFDRTRGNIAADAPRFYPGSPWLALALLRPQDRAVFCELHEHEQMALAAEFKGERRVSVQLIDGYTAIRGMLPPPEKRALVLIDPPFEIQDEFQRVGTALVEGLRRLPAATFVVWYPLTERARVDRFLDDLSYEKVPPCFVAEIIIAGQNSPMKMKGCGLLVVNPPWQIEQEIQPVIADLPKRLAQEPGGGGRLTWLVPER
jgi:23S rRNA (adenine2030-N6)-methyltransferase